MTQIEISTNPSANDGIPSQDAAGKRGIVVQCRETDGFTGVATPVNTAGTGNSTWIPCASLAMALELLAECVMILGSRSRSYLAQKRQSSAGSSEARDVPNGFHVGRPAGEAREGTDGSISFARQPSLCEQLVRVPLQKPAPTGVPGRFSVKECEVPVPGVNLFTVRCVLTARRKTVLPTIFA